jgi:putative glycosyltransferase (TIGR04372 family)
MITRAPTVFIGHPGRRVGNPLVVDYFREQRKTRVVTPQDAIRYSLLFRASKRRPLAYPHDTPTLPDGGVPQHREAMLAAQSSWEATGGGPTLQLRSTDSRRGWECLTSLGMGRGDWFVCVHAREPGWLGEATNSEHRHTNADVLTYIDAIEYITAQGGWVIRMGDRSMKPLPRLEHVIDYAHDPGRSDWMDVFLSAECRFFVGSTSGLFVLPFLFGRPVALANFAPMSDRPFGGKDVYIPKLYWSTREMRLLTFAEGFAPPLRHAYHVDPLVELGVVVVDNTPAEILDLAREMLERDRGTMIYSEEDERLQKRYTALATPFFRYGIPSRVGAAFIRSYERLLLTEPPAA